MPSPAEAFDLLPTLEGDTLRLRPVRADDLEPLYAVASDPAIWAQHPDRLRHERRVFEPFFATALAAGALVVIERASGAMIGSSRFYDWDPAGRSVAIGYTFLARSHWGGRTNGELKALMLRHAFRWVDTVWFHIGRDNVRSRKAVEKIGGRVSHEGQKTMYGQVQDYVFYRLAAADFRPGDVRAPSHP